MIKKRRYIMITQAFDPVQEAVFNPWQTAPHCEGFPELAVSCFSWVTMERLVSELHAEKIAELHAANAVIPIWKAEYQERSIALFTSSVGASACISVIEEIFAMGARKLVLFGTCGVLDRSIEDCSIILPVRAVREEGTSFHYAPASEEIEGNLLHRQDFLELCNRSAFSIRCGKTWTTDGVYRETANRVREMQERGCICVDMECSAVFALTQFRGYDIFQFFYAADNLDDEEWDERSLSNHANPLEKDRIARLACDMVLQMISCE